MPHTPSANNPQLFLSQGRIDRYIVPPAHANSPQRQPGLRVEYIYALSRTGEDPATPGGSDTVVDKRDRNADEPMAASPCTRVRHIIRFQSPGSERVFSVALVRGHGARVGNKDGRLAVAALGERNTVGLVLGDVEGSRTERGAVDEIDGREDRWCERYDSSSLHIRLVGI